MDFRTSSTNAGRDCGEQLELKQQQKCEEVANLESDLTALGFSASEINELFHADGTELSRCLGQVLELHVRLQHSIQLQEQHTKTVLRANTALSEAEYQLFGKMPCYA